MMEQQKLTKSAISISIPLPFLMEIDKEMLRVGKNRSDTIVDMLQRSISQPSCLHEIQCKGSSFFCKARKCPVCMQEE